VSSPATRISIPQRPGWHAGSLRTVLNRTGSASPDSSLVGRPSADAPAAGRDDTILPRRLDVAVPEEDDSGWPLSEVTMLSLYRARLVRGPVPAPRPLVVIALYDTVYATWHPHTAWNLRGLGQYPPVYARIPIDEQFGLGLLGGEKVPCPNTDKIASAWRLFEDFSNGFMARAQQVGNADPNYYETKLHCQKCNYRSRVPGHADRLLAEGDRFMCHPLGRMVIHADVPEASVPHPTTGFDFERGCLIRGDDGAVVMVYGSPRARLTDRYLDTYLGPAKRSYRGRDGTLYIARAS
jgi:hypothetical protein